MGSTTSTAAPALVLDLRSEVTPARTLVRDVWRHRDLLPLLARQHFHGEFRAARLGILWSALQPLVRGAVLAIVFTVFVPIDSGETPYPAFVLVGTTVFGYLSTAVTSGTTGITAGSGLASRVYFPRLLLPAMPPAAAFPSHLLTLGMVILVALLVGVDPSIRLLAVPLATALGFAMVVAGSSLLALFHVYTRDVGQLVSAAVGIAFYVTPVIYPASLAGQWEPLLDANPFSGPIAAMRWAMLDGAGEPLRPVLFSLGWTTLFAIAAVFAYRRHERICVDRL